MFSQFKITLSTLEVFLTQAGLETQTLTGDMSRSQRTRALIEFEKASSSTILLMSIRSGAVGINLTQANHVFIMEPVCHNVNNGSNLYLVSQLGN